MARHRDYFYAEHDIEVNLDGTAGLQLQANVVTDVMAELTDYWIFYNQQCGKDNVSGAVPKTLFAIESSGYIYEFTQSALANTYYSFSFADDLQNSWSGSTGLWAQNYAGG